MKNWTMTILLVAQLLPGCSGRSSSNVSNLIKDRGTFPSPDGKYELVIASKSKSLVDYKIVQVRTGESYCPDKLFSNAMRWAAYWEGSDTLWIYSSDMGLSIWNLSSDGDFSQQWHDKKSDLIARIPQELWEFMPSSYRRLVESKRNLNAERIVDEEVPVARESEL